MMNNYLNKNEENPSVHQASGNIEQYNSAFNDQVQFLIKKGELDQHSKDFT